MVSLKFSDHSFNGGGDKLSFLSNFYISKMRFKNHTYKSVEHLYQAVKCVNRHDKTKIRHAATPKEAKILGRFVETRDEWNDEVKKIDMMYGCLYLKFKKPKMMRKLLQTADVELTYINYWHDTFWGVCTCTIHKHTGRNLLGKLLMHVRANEKKLTEPDV